MIQDGGGGGGGGDFGNVMPPLSPQGKTKPESLKCVARLHSGTSEGHSDIEDTSTLSDAPTYIVIVHFCL